MDIAKGLQYLHEHEPKIVHGDLKGVSRLCINSDSRYPDVDRHLGQHSGHSLFQSMHCGLRIIKIIEKLTSIQEFSEFYYSCEWNPQVDSA
jgi:hypothetical protein